MNVVPIDMSDTLPVIFDRGLIGIYHDWCESFNTYPRTYDLLHSNFLLGNISQRCIPIPLLPKLANVLAENKHNNFLFVCVNLDHAYDYEYKDITNGNLKLWNFADVT